MFVENHNLWFSHFLETGLEGLFLKQVPGTQEIILHGEEAQS